MPPIMGSANLRTIPFPRRRPRKSPMATSSEPSSRGRTRSRPARTLSHGERIPVLMWPFIRTGILSPWDKVRAGLDLVLPRLLGSEDVAIGDFLGRRLGKGIVRKFADPMIGGIYGATVEELSLDAVLPSLRVSERDHRSLMLASLAQGRSARVTPGAGSPS